ncbi:hypothetical protein C1645_879988 [Glomus cerebriforme]|uniref:Uncharacterized protein n=1 Tax=Glomus cerebriforme TaxID=658196 RepID=A0A397SNB2_9GLOM|nr:hypothetical protein C1645_879988 [Glomus cerebriforme]
MTLFESFIISNHLPNTAKKDKLALISYDYNTYTILYEAYAQVKATIAENTMLSTPNFEPACISNTGASTPEIFSRTSLDDLVEAYFDSVQKNAGKK